MRSLGLFLVLLAVALPLGAWERLVTRQGAEVQGDITQQEFVFIDPAGGEVAIPRAAIVKIEADPTGLRATVKDGTVVTGELVGKIEIEDGLVRRRYASGDLESVEFDRYILVEKGKQYSSCPIRIDIPAGALLLEDDGETTTTSTRAVNCEELRVAHVRLTKQGKLKPGKNLTITADVMLTVPAGEDQLVDLAGQLMQGDNVLAQPHQRLIVDEGKSTVVPLKFYLRPDQLTEGGPPLRFLLQVVNQDESRQVEKGGFFWWFTIPVPLSW
jgi:hypothetical protein